MDEKTGVRIPVTAKQVSFPLTQEKKRGHVRTFTYVHVVAIIPYYCVPPGDELPGDDQSV